MLSWKRHSRFFHFPWPPQRPLPPSFPKLKARVELSRAKHRSLAGHSKMSRRVAKLLPFYEFEGDKYFGCDGAPDNVVMQRKEAFFRLARSTPIATPRAAR